MIDDNKQQLQQTGSKYIKCQAKQIRGLCSVLVHDNVHPPHSSSAKIECVFDYSPSLFGKRIVVHSRQTCKQQQTHLLKKNLSVTIKPIDNSCMLSSNPSINPVVC